MVNLKKLQKELEMALKQNKLVIVFRSEDFYCTNSFEKVDIDIINENNKIGLIVQYNDEVTCGGR